MKTTTKVAAGFATMAALVVVTGASGHLASEALRDDMERLIGPLWDTADGSMESMIQLQRQVIAVSRLMASDDAATQQAVLTEASTSFDEAIGRVVAAGILPPARLTEIGKRLEEYRGWRVTLIEKWNLLAATRTAFDREARVFVQFSGVFEAHGDTAVEALMGRSNALSAPGLGWEARWAAADGAMEATIGMLQQLHAVATMQSGRPIGEVRADIAAARAA